MTLARELARRIVAMRYEDLPSAAVDWSKIASTQSPELAFVKPEAPVPRVAVTGRS